MKSSLRIALGMITVGAAFAFAGCSDDEPAPSDAGGAAGQAGQSQAGAATGGASDSAVTCEVIGELCHEADTGSGPGHDCHELGHEAHAAACVAGFSDCIALCVVDEGAAGAGGGGSEPALDAHCAALGELCHPVDDTDGPLHECHELGHVGNAVKCAAEFDSCAKLCLAAREEQESGTGGTSGGAGAAGGDGGGASNGGAATAGASSGGLGGAAGASP